MDIKDVKKNEYYYAEYGINDYAIIKPIFDGNFNDSPGIGIDSYNNDLYYYKNSWSCENSIRKATYEEKQWLDLCIKHRKIMPKPEFKQKTYELW